jgi:glutamine amidotransferase
MASIVIIDYGMGNLHSIAKAVEHVAGGTGVWVSTKVEDIRRADRVIFPGVGGIRDCMSELQRLELDQVIREVAQTKPLLGVCLGMQALLEASEENGGVTCLGLIPGRVCRFPEPLTDPASGERLKVPHMGWNQVQQVVEHPLWKKIPDASRFYFVHSYFARPEATDHVAGVTEYGRRFAAVVARENLFAVQFHPEKSQHVGLQLLANFVSWDGEC